MKYCSHCGQALDGNSNVCPVCGKTNESQASSAPREPKESQASSAPREPKESGLATAAKILMILGTIVNAISGFLIPLAWCIPMTISYCRKLKRGEPISTGFKVCSLLFVSLLGGILMLCDKDN